MLIIFVFVDTIDLCRLETAHTAGSHFSRYVEKQRKKLSSSEKEAEKEFSIHSLGGNSQQGEGESSGPSRQSIQIFTVNFDEANDSSIPHTSLLQPRDEKEYDEETF